MPRSSTRAKGGRGVLKYRGDFGAGGQSNAGRFGKKARKGAHADDDAEEPVAEAVPPTPVAAPVQHQEKSPPLVSPPPISRSKAAARRPFDTARSVRTVMK